MTQASFYLNKTSVSQSEINLEVSFNFISAAQATKKCLTNSFISRRPIDFYLKNIYKGSSILEEYNFYTETNLNKLKLFLENFLTELNKSPLSPTKQTSGFSPDNSGFNTLENKNYELKDLLTINEQLNDLKSCLKHFTNSLSELNKAESAYLEDIEKSNLASIAQMYKVNRQALFKESENLILFTNSLVHQLGALNSNINRVVKTIDSPNTSRVRVKSGNRSLDEGSPVRLNPVYSPEEKEQNSPKEASKVSFQKKEANNVDAATFIVDKSFYSTGLQKTESIYQSYNFAASNENIKPPEIFSLNDLQTLNESDEKLNQLLKLNKMLENELISKEEQLKQIKRSLLKEVQDSNDLRARVQLKEMIEENIHLKDKLDETLAINDEFERILVEKNQDLQRNIAYQQEGRLNTDQSSEDHINLLDRRVNELEEEIGYLKRANLELKNRNFELKQKWVESNILRDSTRDNQENY